MLRFLSLAILIQRRPQIFLLAILTALTIAVVGSIAWEADQLRDDLAAYSRIDTRAAFLPESCGMRLYRLYGKRGASAWNFYGAIGEEATPCWRANSKADCHFEKTPPLGSARMAPAETTCSSLPAGVAPPTIHACSPGDFPASHPSRSAASAYRAGSTDLKVRIAITACS